MLDKQEGNNYFSGGTSAFSMKATIFCQLNTGIPKSAERVTDTGIHVARGADALFRNLFCDIGDRGGLRLLRFSTKRTDGVMRPYR